MKNGHKYKIDVNSYSSKHYPVALFRWKPGIIGGSWEHQESFQTQAEARAHYDAIVDQIGGLPIYL